MSVSYSADDLAAAAKANANYGAAVKEYLGTTGLYESVPVGEKKNEHQWRTAPNRAPHKLSNFKKLFECISMHNSSVLKDMPLVSNIFAYMHTCTHAHMHTRVQFARSSYDVFIAQPSDVATSGKRKGPRPVARVEASDDEVRRRISYM